MCLKVIEFSLKKKNILLVFDKLYKKCVRNICKKDKNKISISKYSLIIWNNTVLYLFGCWHVDFESKAIE